MTISEILKAWYENRLYHEPDEEEKFFHWAGCEVCHEATGEVLADDVVTVKVWLTMEDLKKEDKEPGQYYEINVCNECLCRFHYGE